MLEKIESLCLWVKGLKVDLKSSLIISWNKTNICFHGLDGKEQGKLQYFIKDLMTSDIILNDIMINMDYRYFCTAQSNGEICVYKLENQKKKIHTFTGHIKEITCITPTKQDSKLFLSASLDLTVRIWSLDKFQLLYTLNLPYSGVTFA